MFVDSHCQLNMMVSKKINEILNAEELSKIEKIVQDAAVAKVTKIINMGTSLNESLNSVAIAIKCKNVFAAVGIHPCDCDENWERDLNEIEKLVKEKDKNKIVSIGEIGLDFFHKPFDENLQKTVFIAQLELAARYDLPVEVHIRNSLSEVLEILFEFKGKVRGVNHCFVYDKNIADKFLDLGFFLGIGGPITYPKNDKLREVVKNISLEHIILETDAPFLPPQQFRGEQNHPKYIPIIAQAIAALRNISIEDVAMMTSANVQKLFGV
ncbi:TPA: TatD family deoxyribonuclease [Candidatus Dependentiae bacterium]|nr:MAG: hypothetical protein UR14_C0004G0102 [candidate division TM6 bacterium GW2011_GWE2_31_21]KKP53022.1 MAG: hypothetical protein UR43_C0008G0104 [candidate division TM6 bacterium GW2011_GWF2_33_332]HBS47741.1 TatD family deoxyribonuclease [Candidatus Dependentiae bacterium]HBZ73283.1 TatD family deoxyribonuclease [Candidatus Dependentiae bacterium]